MPKVSVAICAYNAQDHLAETIDSVLTQTFRDFELVIVDDGSKDRTADVCRDYAARDERVRYHFQPNAGFGAARNKCLELARSEWIAIIDHDDVCLPRRLERQLEDASAHPEAALIFSNTEHFTDDGAVRRRQFDGFDPCDSDLGPGRATELLLTRGCFIDSESAFFRRDAALALGGFPTAYRYINDYDFFLRLGMRHAMHGIPEVLARWRIHKGQLSQTARETILREHVAVFKEWLQSPALSASTKRIVRMRLASCLLKAAAEPALRAELGGLPGIGFGVLAGLSGLSEPGWILARAQERLHNRS